MPKILILLIEASLSVLFMALLMGLFFGAFVFLKSFDKKPPTDNQ